MSDNQQTLALLQLLERRVGLRLAGQAAQVQTALHGAALRRGVDARMYLELLADDTALLERFAAQFIVPETHFFRVGPQIEALQKTVFPALMEEFRDAKRLQLWSAGCSTGEEAYTLAMLASEALNLRDWDVRVLGSDLHTGSLEVARGGTYGEWSFRDTPRRIRDGYFESQLPESQFRGSIEGDWTGGRWRVCDALRRLTRFQALNLLADDWGLRERFQLILCRNVTIYFAPTTAQGLIERFAAQLVPGGWLILGPSDPPPLPATLESAGLEAQFQYGAILYRRRGAARAVDVAAGSKATLKLPPLFFPPIRPPSDLTHDLARRDRLPPAEPDIGDLLEAGLHALEADQLPQALEALRRAAYLHPDSGLAQFALARAFQRTGQLQRARAALRQAGRALARLEAGGLEAVLDVSSTVSTASIHPETDWGVQDLRRAVTALSVMLGDR